MANRFLNNITINDEYTLPSVDGTAGQAITTDGAGNLSFATVDSDSALKITLRVKNVSGATLNAGTLVRVAPKATPPSGNVLEVDVADNSAASTMPAIGITIAAITDGSEGDAVAFGRASGFSTSGYTEGDPIWVGSNGAFVGTKPTGSDLIQRVGQIIKVHSSNGSIEVFGAGRTNDVPNLSVGKIWVGTTTNTAESTLVEIDETNNILTVGGKIYYSNVFSQESDLPSATTYHGMFAHVHGTGYAYYAHAGAWVKLAKHSELVAAANDATITLTAGTGLSGGGDFTTDQATNETITVDLADTAVTPGTYGDANNTPQITIDQQGRITSATTVATAGSGSGGGGAGGVLSIERDVFTATALQTAFTISSEITASSNTQVYIDGVYQAKSNYTTSGSTITFSTGVPAGAEVEVVHFISVLSKVYTDTFTGDASTVNFTASKDVTDENVTQVYIDGVYQSKDNYTTSGTTITFSTAPPSGSAIEVVHFTPATYSTLNSNQFTGTGSQTDFTLTQEVDEDKSFVFLQGIYQEKSTYSISGTTLTFTTAPQNGYSIEVITVGEVSMLPDTIDIDNFSGTGSQVDFVLTSTPSTENAIDVYINGLYQQKDTFSLSGNTLTFSTAPPNGSTIEVKHQFVASVKGEVTLTAGTGISVTKNSNNNFTIENTLIDVTVSYNTPTGQSLTYTTPSSSIGQAGSIYGPQTFTITDGTNILSGTASISGLPNGLTASQSYDNSGPGNILTITLGGVFPSANSLNTNLVISGLTSTQANFDIDFLVVAGGAGGGGNWSGGGGAGGLRTSYGSTSGGGSSAETTFSGLPQINYTLTVGGGGANGTGYQSSSKGTNGGDSVFGTITSAGGGGGGADSAGGGYADGLSGGSGGGGGYGSTANAAGTANQGYQGGAGFLPGPSQSYATGGGGGASAAGQDGVAYQSGNGGNGLSVSITGSSITYAGGGGGGMYTTWGAGGAGGTGGGGAGSNNGTAGTANTGGGGGGGWQAGASGGSGIVILRYPNTKTITVGAGLTSSTTTDGSDKVTTFTAGTGTISFS